MSEELFPVAAEPNWAVIPIHQKQSKQEIARKTPLVVKHYELLFRGKVHAKRKGEGGLKTLKEMARFMNERGMEPKPKIQCLADEGLDPLPKKLSNA